jgi:hypothetical protein
MVISPASSDAEPNEESTQKLFPVNQDIKLHLQKISTEGFVSQPEKKQEMTWS